MPSKQESSEDVYDVVLQDPRDKARATLPEPQTPAREGHLPRLQRLQRGHRYTTDHVSPSEPSGRWAMGNQPIQRTAQVKGSNGAPTSRSDVYRSGNAGWPTGRESYGHGAPIVVGGRKGSDPPSTTGKPATGRRGSRRKPARVRGATPTGRAGASETQPRRYVRCVQPSRSWGSFIRAQRNEALESWVRSKDACPVREGAEGKGPEVVPRRRPTSRGKPGSEGGRWKRLAHAGPRWRPTQPQQQSST